MPVPISEALADQSAGARAKAEAASNLPRYLVSSMLAGAYVGVAVVLLLMTSSSMLAAKAADTRLVQGTVFGIALTLVVFAGAELFTGNVMVMVQGLLSRSVTAGEAAVVCAGSLLGNLVGSLAFSGLVAGSGVITGGVPAGTQSVVHAALAGIIKGKMGLSGGQLFFRAVLCNMLVCLALWMAARTKSDAAKLICLFWALLAFVASGFEHSVANMTVFSLALFTHVDGASWSAMARNLLFTVPGNIVGGGLLVGLAYAYVGRSKLITSPEPVNLTDGAVLTVPATTVAVASAPTAPAGGRTRARRVTSPPPTAGARQNSGRLAGANGKAAR